MNNTLTREAPIGAILGAIKDAEPLRDTRFVDKIAVGQYARQGDVYITRIAEVNRDLKQTTVRQLAPGTTQGSRHIVATPSAKIFAQNRRLNTTKGVRILGPQIETKEHLLIEHPEHAHISLPPGCYEVSYQYDPSTDRQVRD